MKTSDFDYSLPPRLIAQTPVEPRDQARLMVVNRGDSSVRHQQFSEIADYLRAGDVLLFNDSRVIPARLSGKINGSGTLIEILLLRRLKPMVWEALVRPGKRVKTGNKIEITGGQETGDRCGSGVIAETISSGEGGIRILSFSDETLLPDLGKIPLPPYIHVPLSDPERYQTVYADAAGSIAAPTAGLHFTPELMNKIRDRGVRCCFATLHVGLDTFRPVREEDPRRHPIHREYGRLSRDVAAELSRAKSEGRRVICVGTTTVRLVEAAAQISHPAPLMPFSDWVDLFIMPGYRFKIVDALITNFHLPRSTLLMLVSAFAGKELIDGVYHEAIAREYRFYSFGDAMLVL